MHRVCAIIATNNRREPLKRLLLSVESQDFQDLDVFVVDNASIDGTSEMVRSDFPKVHLIVQEANLGASGGANIGLRYGLSQGYEYCWLLDNDCVCASNTLACLVSVLDRRPVVAMVASKVLVLDGSGRRSDYVHEIGGAIDWRHGKLVLLGNGEVDFPNCPEDFAETEYVAMTSLLLRSSFLKRYGLLREQFFVYGEDVEISLRYRRLGYQVGAARASRVWHVQGAHKSTTPLREYYAARNYLYLYWEMAPGFFRITSLYHHLRRSLNLMTTFALEGRREYARAIYAAIVSFYRGKLIPFQPLASYAPRPESSDGRFPGDPHLILIISRGATSELIRTLERVRATFPHAVIDVLLLHSFGEQIDTSAYQVRRVIVRPSGLRHKLHLLRHLVTRGYDVTIPSEPVLTPLYESAAPFMLEWGNDGWRAMKINWARKLVERAIAVVFSQIGAGFLLLALPARSLWISLFVHADRR